MRKARKIRARLGADGNLMEPVWRKLKGMHQKTFDRLVREEERANMAASMAIDSYLNRHGLMACGCDLHKEEG